MNGRTPGQERVLGLVPPHESPSPTEPLVVVVTAVATDAATTTLSRNPRLCRLVAIGTAVSGGKAVCHVARTVTDEKIMLDEWWHRVERVDGRVVTWNGAWDLRLILLRSVALRVPMTLDARQVDDWFVPRSYSPHFDVHAALRNWDVACSIEALDDWSTFFGLESEKAPDPAEVLDLVRRRDWDTLGAYSRATVARTDAVYRRVRTYFPSDASRRFG